jgi:two-component system sensor histidine kinase KdpD
MRVCLSAGVIGLVLTGGREVRHVNVTAMALALVLVVLCIALVWQWLEALVAALVAGLGLDYFFLPPINGVGIRDPQHWVALFVFLATAVATGQLSARIRRLQAEAIQRQTETEKLHRVSQSLWECGSAETIIRRLPGTLLDILGLHGVAVYDKGTDRIWRSGEESEEIGAAELRAVAASGNDFRNPNSTLAIAAVRGGKQL